MPKNNLKPKTMKKEEFDSLFLNMLDILEVTLKNFYYTIIEENGRKKVDYGYNKNNEKDWILCTDLYGEYCGENYHQDGSLNMIKIRVLHPFKMSNDYYSFLEIDHSAIVSIRAVDKKPTSAMDNFCHLLASGQTIYFALNSNQ
jgi:hypothetical protein